MYYVHKKRERSETVPFNFSEFFASILEAKFDFLLIGEWINSVYANVIANTTILDIWNDGVSALAPLAPYLSALFLLASLVVAFFGKKLAEPIKFVSIFAIAFCLGVCYIAPLLDPFVVLPHWIMGLIVAAVCAVLYKFIYVAIVSIGVGYSVYMIVMRPDVFTAILAGNVTASLLIAAVALTLLFVFRKYTELVGFAFFGAWLTALCVKSLYDYTALVDNNGWILTLIFTIAIAIPGTIVQFKMRKRY